MKKQVFALILAGTLALSQVGPVQAKGDISIQVNGKKVATDQPRFSVFSAD